MSIQPIDRVHVVDTAPAFRRGLTASFREAGYATTEHAEPPASPFPKDTAVILALTGSAAQLDEELIGGGVRIAVIDGRDLEAVVELMRMGINGIIDRNAATETAVAAVTVACDGHCLLPSWAVGATAARMPTPVPASTWVGEDEIGWLRLLAGGSTIAGLADTIGYSERETFRLLHDLYARIGVANRTEALMWATRHGLVTPPARR